MTGHYEYLDNVRDINFIMVGLPNRNRAIASKIGTVDFRPNLKLEDVLFIPKLNCNLISIYQLSKDLNCYDFYRQFLCGRGVYLEDTDWSG